MSQPADAPKTIPPYVSWTMFTNFCDRLKQAMPSKIDRSLMKDISGSTQAQLLHALRYLKMIDGEDGRTQPILSEFAMSEGESRKTLVAKMLADAYPFLGAGDFDLRSATPGELKAKFTDMGAKAESARKCQSFFMAMVNVVGLEVSPHIKSAPKSAPGSSGKARRSRVRKDAGASTNGDTPPPPPPPPAGDFHDKLLDKLPVFNPEWGPEAVANYLKVLNAVQAGKAGK